MNLFQGIKSNLQGSLLTWLNEPEKWGFQDDKLVIQAPAGSNLFHHPAGWFVANNAPFLYTHVKGDFTVTTRIEIDMQNTYDAGCLLVMAESDQYVKYCYENWLDEPSIVSVVTRKLSDDCPSLRIGVVKPYFKIVRSGNCFELSYSIDAQNWILIRYFHLDVPEEVKVGVVAQSPVGEGCSVGFEFFDIEMKGTEFVYK